MFFGQIFSKLVNDYFRMCCQCGNPIEPNPANMCVGCLRTQVDISEGIPKQVIIYFCKGCERLDKTVFLFLSDCNDFYISLYFQDTFSHLNSGLSAL